MKLDISMKHPFWLANSILFILLCAVVLFVVVSQQKKPRRVPFEPEDVKPLRKDVSKVDPSKIYTNDLFNTYREPIAPAIAIGDIKPIPLPPQPALMRPVAPPPPRFLDPLNITLKGIILTSEEKDNRAIIEDNKSKVAKNYKVGDKLDDAQIIRILKNKVMLIRSNGQQETLYVNQFDAKAEQLLKKDDWSGVVKKVNDTNYLIDPHEFVNRVRSLAQLIDILNITTVYQKGKSVGVRIGKLDAISLGSALGLQTGDIITTINEIAATNTAQRFEIYKKIVALDMGASIAITLIRNNQPMSMTYTLESVEKEEEPQQNSARATKIINPEQQAEQIMQEKIAYSMPDALMRKLEKHDMLEQGKKKPKESIS